MITDSGKHYLYRHIRLDINTPFYIGIGTQQEKKKDYYRAYTKNHRNIYWKRIINKINYRVEILLESDDYEFIKQKEIEFISLYGRIDLKTGYLANLTEGGDGLLGYIPTEENRKKASERMKNISNEQRLRISEKLKGRTLSKETLEKRSISIKGVSRNKNSPGYKALSEKMSKPVLQYDKEMNFIKEWKNAYEANKEGYSNSKISSCCNNKRPFHRDCIWKFKEQTN